MGDKVGARPSETGSRPTGQAQFHDLGAPRFDPARYRELFPISGYAPGRYLGTCQTCQAEIMADKRSWRCLDCALASLQRSFVAIDRALRIRLWNEAKGRGMNDRNAMLNGGDGVVGDFGWNITALNKARPHIRALLKDQ